MALARESAERASNALLDETGRQAVNPPGPAPSATFRAIAVRDRQIVKTRDAVRSLGGAPRRWLPWPELQHPMMAGVPAVGSDSPQSEGLDHAPFQ